MSKYQWTFTKLGVCIDIIEIWFRNTIGRIWSVLTELSAHHTIVVGYNRFKFLYAHLKNVMYYVTGSGVGLSVSQ